MCVAAAHEIVDIGCDLQLSRDMLWGEAVTDFSELEEKGKLCAEASERQPPQYSIMLFS